MKTNQTNMHVKISNTNSNVKNLKELVNKLQNAGYEQRFQLKTDHKGLEIYKDRKVKRPDNWGGYLVKPNIIEFWQGRENRLHDRLRFVKTDSDNWKLERLSP